MSYDQRRTRCNGGHLFTAENTYYESDGRKLCRACKWKKERRQMAKRQTRRTVSISAEAYALLAKMTGAMGCSRAGWVEAEVKAHAAAEGITVTREEVRAVFDKNPVRKLSEEERESERRRLAEEAFGTMRFSG